MRVDQDGQLLNTQNEVYRLCCIGLTQKCVQVFFGNILWKNPNTLLGQPSIMLLHSLLFLTAVNSIFLFLLTDFKDLLLFSCDFFPQGLIKLLLNRTEVLNNLRGSVPNIHEYHILPT